MSQMPGSEAALTDDPKNGPRRSSVVTGEGAGNGMTGREDCRSEALDWMILLQEQPDDPEVAARFRQWRQAAGKAAAWRELDHAGDMIRQAHGAGEARSMPVTPGWKRVLPVAMAACVAALLTGRAVPPSVPAALATGIGEVRTMMLADGSRVTLAPDSAIAWDGESTREVRLLRGTGYFEVRHDAAHPFRVQAGEAVATDLGTAFEVRREEHIARIAVREGLVRASCAQGGIDPGDLRPGDVADLDCASGRLRRSSAAPSAMASWTQGQLVVTDRPLGEVVAALRPWRRGLLLARGSGMARHVTGVYDLRRPDRALTALRRAHGVTIWQVTPWITIVTAG